MTYTIVRYQDTTQEIWDGWVQKIVGTAYYHTWHWIQFISHFPHVKENLSFVILDGSSSDPLAVCPLAVSQREEEGEPVFAFGDFFCGAPAVDTPRPSDRRKILDYIFSIILSHQQTKKCREISFGWHPLNSTIFENNGQLGFAYSFELLRYNLVYAVENTLVMDLHLSEEELAHNVGQYQYRHIKRGRKKGLLVETYNKENNSTALKDALHMFQLAHATAAGRTTRPQGTWDAMYDGLKAGKASLFIVHTSDSIPISYLYCGEYGKMAFGWSQANVKEYEEAFSPRHLLEWTAILYYKSRGFAYYEVGERYFGPQFSYVPSDKEISISVFKERYGGALLPKVKWIGYFEIVAMEKAYRGHMEDFLRAKRPVSIPEER